MSISLNQQHPPPIRHPGAPTAQPIAAPPTARPANTPVDPVDIFKTPAPVLPPVLVPTRAPITPVTTAAPLPTPVPEATPVPSAQAHSVSGFIIMSENALAQCEVGCAEGIAAAFDLQPYRVRQRAAWILFFVLGS